MRPVSPPASAAQVSQHQLRQYGLLRRHKTGADSTLQKFLDAADLNGELAFENAARCGEGSVCLETEAKRLHQKRVDPKAFQIALGAGRK